MALYQPKGCRRWWISVYRRRNTRLRVSSGTENRQEAEVLERTLRLAQARTTPRQRLHAAIDALLGADDSATVGVPLAGLWAAASAAQASAGGRSVTPRTADNRRQACNRLATWAAEHWPRADTMQAVDRAAAFAFGDYLAKQGAAVKTRSNLIGELGTIWRMLMPRTGIMDNPWTLAKPRKGDDGKHGRPFTRPEEKAVLAAARAVGHDWHDVCQVARLTGLRYGDVARLRWGEVDVAGGRLRVKPSKTARHGIELGIPMHPTLAKILAARPREPSGWVFPEHGARYKSRQSDVMPFRDVLEKAGIATDAAGLVTFHSWRHTFRTRLSEAGAPQEIAMALGGWTQAATAGMYSHDWTALEKAVKALKG